MLPKWNERKALIWPLFVGLVIFWTASLLLYQNTFTARWMAALDLCIAGLFWLSIFSGSPVLAVWAQKRDVYRQMHALAQPVLFDFLLMFTSRVGWLFFARALSGWIGFFWNVPSDAFVAVWLIAGLGTMSVQYAILRSRLARAFTLTRRSSESLR